MLARARSAGVLLLEQVGERRFGAFDFGLIARDVGSGPRFEVIAKIRLVLAPDFFGRRLAAMLGIAQVILDTEPADMQLRVARPTGV